MELVGRKENKKSEKVIFLVELARQLISVSSLLKF